MPSWDSVLKSIVAGQANRQSESSDHEPSGRSDDGTVRWNFGIGAIVVVFLLVLLAAVDCGGYPWPFKNFVCPWVRPDDFSLDFPRAAVTWSALIGLFFGAAELVGRYRDDPWAAVRTKPGLAYIAVNIIAAVVALIVLWSIQPNWIFGPRSAEPSNAPDRPPAAQMPANPRDSADQTLPEVGSAARPAASAASPSPMPDKTAGVPNSDNPSRAQRFLLLVLTAGVGSAALFRSSLFKLRTPDGEIAVGPSVILDTLLFATDRYVDRSRAGPRADVIAKAMDGVSFARAAGPLPAYCFALMQNVSPQEIQRIESLRNSLATADWPDQLKAYSLGLALYTIVGKAILDKAVKDLKDSIADPLSDDQPPAKLVQTMANVDFGKAIAVLPFYCALLKPLQEKEQTEFEQKLGELAKLKDVSPRTRSIALGLILLDQFHQNVLNRALNLAGDDLKRSG